MTMTEQARRKRRRSCEWCGEYLEDLADHFGVAWGKQNRKRIDARFCSHSCRQQSYNARKHMVWTIDGEELTGQELVDRGWTLSLYVRPSRHHERRPIVANPPGEEPHPLAEMRQYKPRKSKG